MKVCFKDTKFIVNNEKKTVTCVIKAELSIKSGQENVFGIYDLERPFVAVGISKCHPEDQFSVETGKRIAESRAKKAVYIGGRERFEKLLKYIDIFGSEVSKAINDLGRFKNKESEHIDFLKSNN